jgi:sulfite reductase beta subunit-like hemoprotein
VRAFAREGRSSVVPEWASFYFKWWGIYTQGDGVGVTGGKGGEGLASDYFMMRIGIPNGILSATSFASSAAHPQIRPQPGRHYRAPEHPASLAHH